MFAKSRFYGYTLLAASLIIFSAFVILSESDDTDASQDETFIKSVDGMEMKFKVLTENGSVGTVQTGDGTVSAIPSNTTGTVNIPEKADHNGMVYTVTMIGDNSFDTCEQITSVRIPSTVDTIGMYAFYKCTDMTSVNIPNGVETIGVYAFGYCSSIESVTIPSGVKTIDAGSFGYCSSLTSVAIPDSVTTMALGAFNGCISLKSVSIGNGVKEIMFGTFYKSAIESLTIPAGVTTIESEAFNLCGSMTSLSIPDTVTSMGAAAFNNGFKKADGTVIAEKDVMHEHVSEIVGHKYVLESGYYVQAGIPDIPDDSVSPKSYTVNLKPGLGYSIYGSDGMSFRMTSFDTSTFRVFIMDGYVYAGGLNVPNATITNIGGNEYRISNVTGDVDISIQTLVVSNSSEGFDKIDGNRSVTVYYIAAVAVFVLLCLMSVYYLKRRDD